MSHLRKTALSFPQTTEQESRAGTVTFAIGETPFAAARDHVVELYLPTEDADRILERHPTAERLGRRGVRIPIRDINGQQLNHWLRRAWLSRAPAGLAKQVAAADTAIPGEVGDLPRAIGSPATRALVGAGIMTLAQVAERSEAELKALHGVGPRAIRVLKEALSASGRRLKA